MKLSKHFTKHEFERSSTAVRFDIDNSIPDELIPSLVTLCENVLEPLREAKGPVHINSGYRSLAVNKKVGSSSRSQHTKCEASDITHNVLSPYELCVWIRDNPDIKFDQLIYEGYWAHVSYGPRMRNQCLTAIFKKDMPTKYVSGIIKK